VWLWIPACAEFGRAYLSERWATDFIRSVLERYIVVFVGYAADDPPMQYLLEALNRTAGSLSGVYAFQSGSIEDAEARWIQKGVKPIAYDQKSGHDALWKTLEAWAVLGRAPTARDFVSKDETSFARAGSGVGPCEAATH
jgi:hypothetical protein